MVRTGVIKAVEEEETNVGASKTTSIANGSSASKVSSSSSDVATIATLSNVKKARLAKKKERKKSSSFGWKERMDELIVYKEKNGNCNVPQRKSRLGSWVLRQRQSHRKGKLSHKSTPPSSKILDLAGIKQQMNGRIGSKIWMPTNRRTATAVCPKVRLN